MKLDRGLGLFDERLQRRGIRPALVERDLGRETVLLNRFLEEAPRGFLVTLGRQQEVNGLAVSVDGTVKISPLAFELDIRFVHLPTPSHRSLLAFPKGGLQRWRELLDPAIDIGMINLNATLCHH